MATSEIEDVLAAKPRKTAEEFYRKSVKGSKATSRTIAASFTGNRSKGGEATSRNHNREFYQEIGRKGGRNSITTQKEPDPKGNRLFACIAGVFPLLPINIRKTSF